MRFAVIGDIHSNLFALESVLQDIAERDTDFIICTGDVVGYSPYPNEVIELLRRNSILTVQGNYDKAIGNKELICGCEYTDPKDIELAADSVYFTNQAINENNRLYLRNLPQLIRFQIGELRAVVVHGSPFRINEPILHDSPEFHDIIAFIPEDIIICGHTHIPYFSEVNGKYIINPGAVGKPKTGRDAVYAVVDIADNRVYADLIRVSYDVEKAAQAIENDNTLPDEFAEMLRGAR